MTSQAVKREFSQLDQLVRASSFVEQSSRKGYLDPSLDFEESGPATKKQKSGSSSYAATASQQSKSIRSKNFYRLRELLISTVRIEDDATFATRFATVPASPLEFYLLATHCESLTVLESEKLKAWGGEGIEQWEPKDIRKHYENFFGKEYLQIEHRSGREICLYGAFLYTILCKAYNDPKQREKLTEEQFQAELEVLFKHEKLSDSRFASKKAKMGELDKHRLMLAWNVIRVMSKFISGKGNVDYLLFLIAIVDRSGRSYSKGAWTNMSFEATCRRLIIENEGQSFLNSPRSFDSPLKADHTPPDDDDNSNSADEDQQSSFPKPVPLTRRGSGDPGHQPSEAASTVRPSTSALQSVNNGSSHGSTAAPAATGSALTNEPLYTSVATAGSLTGASRGSNNLMTGTQPTLLGPTPSLTALAKAQGFISAASALPYNATQNFSRGSFATGGAIVDTPQLTATDVSLLVKQHMEKDKQLLAEELVAALLEKQRMTNEVSELLSQNETLRIANKACRCRQPELIAPAYYKTPEDAVEVLIKFLSVGDRYLPPEIPTSADDYLRAALACRVLKEADYAKLIEKDRESSWANASMDVRKIYETLFTRPYILEEHREGREIILFTSFLYVVLCKVFHLREFQSCKIDAVTFEQEVRHLRSDKRLFPNPAILPSSAAANYAAIGAGNVIEDARLFQAFNIVRVLKLFVSGKSNLDYLLLLLSFTERAGRLYKKRFMNPADVLRRTIIERDGDTASDRAHTGQTVPQVSSSGSHHALNGNINNNSIMGTSATTATTAGAHLLSTELGSGTNTWVPGSSVQTTGLHNATIPPGGLRSNNTHTTTGTNLGMTAGTTLTSASTSAALLSQQPTLTIANVAAAQQAAAAAKVSASQVQQLQTAAGRTVASIATSAAAVNGSNDAAEMLLQLSAGNK